MGRKPKCLAVLVAALVLSGCSERPDWGRTIERDHLVRWERVQCAYDSVAGGPVLVLERELTVITIRADAAAADLEAKSKINSYFHKVAAEIGSKCNEPRAYKVEELNMRWDDLAYVFKDLLKEGKFRLEMTGTHETVREIFVGTSLEGLGTLTVWWQTFFYLPDGRMFYATLDGMT